MFFDISVFDVDDGDGDDDNNNGQQSQCPGKEVPLGSARSETGVSDHEIMVENGIDMYGSGLVFVMKVLARAKALAAASESVSVGSTE